MKLKIHPKEEIYFIFSIMWSLIFYYGLVQFIYSLNQISDSVATRTLIRLYVTYIGLIIIYIVFYKGFLVGYIRNNAVRIHSAQLPEIYEIFKEIASKMGFRKVPELYVLQSGGVLNAFAARFWGKNMVVIYSDILETAYEDGRETTAFILAHELAHLKRFHTTKMLLLFPAKFFPFLMPAYKRGCEYTCDRAGFEIEPVGARKGLLLLAGGKKLYSKIKVDEFVKQSKEARGFWSWFSKSASTHPPLPKRLSNLGIEN
ncbi:MAG TPA: peptidase M48 [Spirochaetia bacterium]|nr:MAG: hypothetical protein A2Y41_03360 [Spirochaetes bacterium GWB1_36_13]HCL56618.1 peptidase M48 [Spirochaetia bacterium]